MLRLLPEARRLCCPACSDVELRVICAADGESFLACAQCLRRFDLRHAQSPNRDAPRITAFSAFNSAAAQAPAAAA
jgi:hypothetical protein